MQIRSIAIFVFVSDVEPFERGSLFFRKSFASPTVHTCGTLSVVENHCPLRMRALRPFLYLKNVFIFITAIAFVIVDRPITLKNKTSCLCLVAHLSPPSMVHWLSSSLFPFSFVIVPLW